MFTLDLNQFAIFIKSSPSWLSVSITSKLIYRNINWQNYVKIPQLYPKHLVWVTLKRMHVSSNDLVFGFYMDCWNWGCCGWVGWSLNSSAHFWVSHDSHFECLPGLCLSVLNFLHLFLPRNTCGSPVHCRRHAPESWERAQKNAPKSLLQL